MKKIFFLLILIYAAANTLNAQSSKPLLIPLNDKPVPEWKKAYRLKQLRDSISGSYHRGQNTPPPGAMPNKMAYIGNNGKGFNIYQTPQDNMLILRPDSSFVSNMPVRDFLGMQSSPADMPNPLKERKN